MLQPLGVGPGAAPAMSESDSYPTRSTADNTTAGLLKYWDGRCRAWADFLRDVWAAQGIGSEVWGITPIEKAYKKNNWELRGFYIKSTLPGQGNRTPQTEFQNHAVVRLGGTSTSVYDPSYGAWYPNEQAWRDAAEDKFKYFDPDALVSWWACPAHVTGKNDSLFVHVQ